MAKKKASYESKAEKISRDIVGSKKEKSYVVRVTHDALSGKKITPTLIRTSNPSASKGTVVYSGSKAGAKRFIGNFERRGGVEALVAAVAEQWSDYAR